MKVLLTIMEDGCELSQLLDLSLDQNTYLVAGHAPQHDESCCSSRLLLIDDNPQSAGQFSVHELIRAIRLCPRCASLPLIVVSSRKGEQDAVRALAGGADDYVRRPFYTAELIGRIMAVLRRIPEAGKPMQQSLSCGPLLLDSSRHTFHCGGRSIELTATEFRILRHMMGNPGMVFSREALLEVGVGEDSFACSRTLDTHMASIRRKLGEQRSMIRTIWGVGYRLENPAEDTEESSQKQAGSRTAALPDEPEGPPAVSMGAGYEA